MKVLYNACYGGFTLSDEFIAEFNKRYPNKPLTDGYLAYGRRNEEDIVALFIELGPEKSTGSLSDIRVHNVPDFMDFRIEDYDGRESMIYEIPYDRIIFDLLNIVHKKETELHEFTQVLLKKGITSVDGIRSCFFGAL